jgi:hypothetical protein
MDAPLNIIDIKSRFLTPLIIIKATIESILNTLNLRYQGKQKIKGISTG